MCAGVAVSEGTCLCASGTLSFPHLSSMSLGRLSFIARHEWLSALG